MRRAKTRSPIHSTRREAGVFLPGHFREQRRQILTAAVLDQLARDFGIKLEQFVQDLLDFFGFAAVMIGHSQLVPGMAVHRLQSRGFAEGRGCFGMLAESGLSQPHAIPGAVEDGSEAPRFLECFDCQTRGIHLFADEAEVEEIVGIRGSKAHNFLQPLFGGDKVLSLRGDGAQMASRLDVLRVVLESDEVGRISLISLADEVE